VITTETEAECQGSLGMQAFKSGVVENQCTAEQVAFRPSLAEQRRYEGRHWLSNGVMKAVRVWELPLTPDQKESQRVGMFQFLDLEAGRVMACRSTPGSCKSGT
jgi:hypothetical protein